MSIQAVVPFEINGEKLYTHTSWFSEKQYNAWTNIPIENSNLAFYFSLSTVSIAAIVNFHLIQVLRRTALVRSFASSYGRIIVGAAGSVGGAYLGYLGLLKAQESSEINRVVSKNECGSTPLWRKEELVVNLRERDYKTFMTRR